MVYIFPSFQWLQYVSIKRNCTSPSKKSPEKPNQKWVQCCMKAPISQVLLQTSLLIVQFSKTFFLCNLFQVFHQLAFKCSINQFLEYHHLTTAIAARLLTNFTFVLQRISKWKFLFIFCYTEVLFSRHSESNRTHIFLEQAVQSLQKISFYEYSGKNSQEGKCSSPRSRQCFRKKMYVMKSVLFSVMLWASYASSVFSSIARPLLLCKQSNIA